MREHSNSLAESGLKGVLAGAVEALARLDAVRLEELAASCQRLQSGPSALELINENRDSESLRRQAQGAAKELATFEGVLRATRANLDVLRRLSGRKRVPLEYSGGAVCPDALPKGRDHGDD
jgi:hypothetical protein